MSTVLSVLVNFMSLHYK